MGVVGVFSLRPRVSYMNLYNYVLGAPICVGVFTSCKCCVGWLFARAPGAGINVQSMTKCHIWAWFDNRPCDLDLGGVV